MKQITILEVKNAGRYFRSAEVNTIIKKSLVSADVPYNLLGWIGMIEKVQMVLQLFRCE